MPLESTSRSKARKPSFYSMTFTKIPTPGRCMFAGECSTCPLNPGFYRLFSRTGGSTVLSVGYDSPTLKSVEDTSMAGIYNFTLHLVQSAYIDGHLVELFPWLKYLPSSLMSWKRRATQGSLRYSALFHGLFNETKAHKVYSYILWQ